jgi:Ca2+-binding RTX toxin-like protein
MGVPGAREHLYDPEGASLIYTASLADGSKLPTWLTFDAAKRSFTGTLPKDFNGPVELKVTASDGTQSKSDTFTLEITPVNDKPVVATPIANQSIVEDQSWTFQVPAEAFKDVDSNLAYKATLASGAALPSWLSFHETTRTFSGTPPLNFNGSLDLTVTAGDGSLSVSDTFTLNITPVNDAPAATAPIADQRVAEDASWAFQLPANTYEDPEGASLTYTASLADGSMLPAWLKFNASTLTFSGTPPADFNGSVELKIAVSDGSLTTFGVFKLIVDPVNDAPVVVAPIADQTMVEDESWLFQVPSDTFSDVDNDLVYTARSADGSALPDWLKFDAATRTFSGTPPVNFTGSFDLTVTASDGSFSISDTFSLNVTPIDDAPGSVPIADQTVTEDTPWLFQVPANAFSDVDSGLAYTATLADDSALPDWLSFDDTTQTFSGTPPLNFIGSLDIKVTASDGGHIASDTFTLTITLVNDAPIVGAPIADQSVEEDTTWSFRIPADAFSDVDGDHLTYSASLSDGSDLPQWLSFDADNGTFTGTPPENATGTFDLTVIATDGSFSASDTFRLTIIPVADKPVLEKPIADQTIVEDTFWSFEIPAGTFTDADSNLTLKATLTDGSRLPDWLIFDANARTFVGMPPSNFTGSLDLTVVAGDGSLSVFDTFTLTVTPANDAPLVVTPIADQTIAEDQAWTFQLPANAFSDAEGSTLAYSAHLAGGALLPDWLTFDEASRTFSGTPPLNFSGNLDITVTASDGSLQASDTFTLAVTSKNDGPVLDVPVSDQTIAEDTLWSFEVPPGTFSDLDSSLTYTAILADGAGLPDWLSFDAATQRFSGIPPLNFHGTLDLKIVANDGSSNAFDTFTLTITPVNDAPVLAVPIADQAIAEGADWSFQIPEGAFSDVDSGLTYTATMPDGSALPTWVKFDESTRTFSGTSPLNQTGSLDFKVTASDGSVAVSDTFTLTIKPAATGPIADGHYDDLIEGGDGDDWIHGGFGNDEIQGEGGNDTIYGAQDNGQIVRDLATGKLTELVIGDNLYGNDGRDTYYYAQGDGIDQIWDFRPGEDIIKVSGFDPSDVKVALIRGVTNRIATGMHEKIVLFFGGDQGAIVFNDFPGPKSTDVILEYSVNGTTQGLTWKELLERADFRQVDDTMVKPVSVTPDSDTGYVPTGTGAPVEISGGNGNDILNGGAGADKLYGNDGYNWFEGFAGDDQLFGGNGQDVLIGAEGRDRLYGNEGINWLDGGIGDDELYGGNVQDTLLGGSGNDVIYSNGGDDVIVGGAGSDKLYGTGGIDIIYGDDADGLVLTLPAMPVIELPPPPVVVTPVSVSTDTSMVLTAGIKNVAATGKSAITLIGNELDNAITGNTAKNIIKAGAGNDEINGGYGNDKLQGNAGQDVFIFNSRLGTSRSDRTANFDTVMDFSVTDDTVRLENAIFKKLGGAGRLKKGFFTIGDKAKDKNDYVIYNKKTGIVSYDVDGTGAKEAIEFAKLSKNLKLTVKDFLIF